MGLEKYFSRRHGYKEINIDIQHESMDKDLRTAIWNSIFKTFLYGYAANDWISDNHDLGKLLQSVWSLYLKKPLDEYPGMWSSWRDLLSEGIYSYSWHGVFDLIEFIFDYWPDEYELENEFIPIFNDALERENSGYRIIGRQVIPITNEAELLSIEEALSILPKLNPVTIQLKESIEKFSDRDNPDFRGSIKDSISAVESLCKIITKNNKATLGEALNIIEKETQITIHKALKKGFSNLYGWTSDDQGIRHSLMDEPTLSLNDAKYMLVSCSAFINYLVLKAEEAGIQILD